MKREQREGKVVLYALLCLAAFVPLSHVFDLLDWYALLYGGWRSEFGVQAVLSTVEALRYFCYLLAGSALAWVLFRCEKAAPPWSRLLAWSAGAAGGVVLLLRLWEGTVSLFARIYVPGLRVLLHCIAVTFLSLAASAVVFHRGLQWDRSLGEACRMLGTGAGGAVLYVLVGLNLLGEILYGAYRLVPFATLTRIAWLDSFPLALWTVGISAGIAWTKGAWEGK